MRRFLPLFLLLAVSWSCVMETSAPDTGVEIPELTACLEYDGKTVLMSDQKTVFWSPSDRINVFYGANSWKFVSRNTVPAAEAVFCVEGAPGEPAAVPGGAEYWAYYPYDEANEFSGDRITVSIGTEQTAACSTFCGSDFPAMAKSSNHNLGFRNICGGFKFSVQKEGVTRVVLRSNGGQTLSGKVRLGFDQKGLPIVKQIVEGSDSIAISSPEDSTFKVGATYFVASLPASLEQGFTVSFSTGSAAGSRSTSKPVTVKRSVIGNLGVADQGVTYSSVLKPGVTLYGYVTCGHSPLAGVVVSDGVNCTRTDGNGLYQLNSEKKNSLVFISIPAYYTVASIQSQPQFYKQLTLPPSEPERKDFTLYRDPGQYSHTRFVFGDIHIYSPKTEALFSMFSDKVNRELVNGVYKLPFGLTLGDMSYERYWYYDLSGKSCDHYYQIPEYLRNINKINNLQVFCTVGNHDHDMKYNGQWWNSKAEYETTGEDWTCEIAYRAQQGPTCYSTNIGEVHYVSMDDAITIDDGTGTVAGRGNKFGYTDVDLEWLRQDMSYVDPSKTVILSVHIPIHSSANGLATPTGHTTAEMFAPFKGRSGKLHVLSAHYHTMFNVETETVDGVTFSEWNTPSVCGDLWRCKDGEPIVCTDGTLSGFRVIEISGKDIVNSKYIPTNGKDGEFYPFRTYDGNEILFSSDSYSRASGWDVPSKDNYIYLYIWDWNSKWKIEVKEDGYGELDVKRITSKMYDPLAIIARDQKMFSSSPSANYRMFKAKAHSATSTVTVKVTDSYGNVAVEKMERPKPCKYNIYKNEVLYGYGAVKYPTNIEDVSEEEAEY